MSRTDRLSLVCRTLLCWVAVGVPLVGCGQSVFLSGSKTPLELSYFGMHIHRATTTTAWPAARFGTLRLWDAGLTWEHLEPTKGNWQFAKLDKYVELARQNGAEPLYTFGVTPRWASARPDEDFVYGKGGRAEPRDMGDWASYVRAVATRYKGRIRYYELWNEPTFSEIEKNKGFYSGSAAKMVEMARVAHKVLKEIDPENKLLSPGIVGGGFERVNLFLSLGGKDVTDIVAYHFYSPNPEQMLWHTERLRAVMAKNKIADRPIWNTEYGFDVPDPGKPLPSSGARDQREFAAYVARSLVIGAAAGIDRFIWYSWDGGNMGLKEKNSQLPGPAGLAYSQTVRWLRGAVVRECRSEDKRFWQCELARGDRRAWMVWQVDAEKSWNPPEHWKATEYETLDGKLVRLKGGEMLPLSPSPLLIKSDSQLWAAGR